MIAKRRNHVVLVLLLLTATLGQAIPAQEATEEQPIFYGEIRGEDGAPVTDATVVIQGPSYERTKVDKNGKFQFTGTISSGSYRVEIRSNGWVGIRKYREMPVVRLNKDEPFEKNFELKKAAQIELKVVDEEGNPVLASVYYKSAVEGELGNALSVKTNAEGKVIIGGLDPESRQYSLGISSKTHGATIEQLFLDDGNPKQKMEIVLKKGESIKSTVICSDGLTAPGWMVYTMPSGWDFGSYTNGVKIGADGFFELKNIVDGKYEVFVFIPMGGGMSSSRSVSSDMNLLKAKEGAKEEPLKFELDYPSPKSLNYLEGDIRWIGKPLDKGLHISGYSAETRQHASFFLEKGMKKFKLGPIPEGTYRIRIDSPEIEVMNLRKVAGLNDLEYVKIPTEDRLQLALRVVGKPTVQGVVKEGESGANVDRFLFRITKLRSLRGPNYVQDSQWYGAKDGKFSMEVVGPGIFQVEVLAEGFALASSESVNTEEEPDKQLEFQLSKGVPVRGQVLDERGVPVSGATVRLLSLAAGSMPRVRNRFVSDYGATTTDDDGQFEFAHVRPGKDKVRIEHPGYSFVEQDVDAVADAEPVRVSMSTGATIYGTVYNSNGKPASGVALKFHDDYAYGGGDRDAGRFGQVVTDRQGNYEIPHLPNTTIYVNRANEWRENGMVRHVVVTDSNGRHRLDFGGTHKLTGRVLANGEPLAETRVQLGGPDTTFGAMKMYAMTDRDGNFTFHGAPPGNWYLSRSLDQRSSEWSYIRRLTVAPNQDIALGDIDVRVGTVKVLWKAESLPPAGFNLSLRRYNEWAYFGRDAGLLQPRSRPEDPFLFNNVSPGDYELAGYMNGKSFCQRLKLTDDDIGSQVEMKFPKMDQKVVLEILNEDGEPHENSFMLVSEDGRIQAMVRAMGSNPEVKKGIFTVTGLSKGTYWLKSGNSRTAPNVAKVEVGEKEMQKFVFPDNLSKGMGLFRVTITDQDGRYLPAKLSFEEQAEVRQAPAVSDVSLSGKAGTYPVEISFPGYETVKTTIELKEVIDSPPDDYFSTTIRLRAKDDQPK